LAARPVRRVTISPFNITIEFEDGGQSCHKFDIHLRLFLITMNGVERKSIESVASKIKCSLKYWDFLGWRAGDVVTLELVESHVKPITIQFS